MVDKISTITLSIVYDKPTEKKNLEKKLSELISKMKDTTLVKIEHDNK